MWIIKYIYKYNNNVRVTLNMSCKHNFIKSYFHSRYHHGKRF